MKNHGNNFVDDELLAHLDVFLNDLLPEPAVLDALSELRWQFHRRKAEPKSPFPGKRAGVDPIDFLLQHYGEDIREGRLNAGRLDKIDRPLFQAVYVALRQRHPPQSVAEFLDHCSVNHSPHHRNRQRAEACAVLLGSDVVEASRFFSGLRAERATKWIDVTHSPKPDTKQR